MSRNFVLILVWLLAVSAPDMSMQDVATYLRVTPRTVRTMVLDRRLKAYQLGPRVIRFRRSEIDAALTPVVEAVCSEIDAPLTPEPSNGP